MNARASIITAVLALLAASAPALVSAQCCQGYSPADACSGATLTKSRWCIEDSVPNAQDALSEEFCAYGDKVVSTLEDVFHIPADEVVEFQLDTQTGGAHTGTSCGHLGVGVAYDAFSGSAYGVPKFWGYLLSLHEAINDWTGMSSPGWPTDWWADHQSAFPNLMDFHIMDAIGRDNGDDDLIAAAAAQKKRFYPGGDSEDPKVVALDNVFAEMPDGDGFAGFSHMLAMQSDDGVKWDDLGVDNPDVKRSEYVVAYMSLAARKPVLSILQGPGKNGGGEVCNGTPDGTQSDEPYTCSATNIDAIATAHCSIAANAKPAADLSALRSGDYADVPSGPCGSACPDECACDAEKHCVAAWLGDAPDAGAGNKPDAGVMGSGGASGSGGSGGRSAGATGGATGAAGSGGASGKGGLGSGGMSEPSSSGGAGGAVAAEDEKADGDSGCGCRVVGARSGSSRGGGGVLFAVLIVAACVRRRVRRA